MPRRWRIASGGLVYHVLNRAVRRDLLFATDADFGAFEDVLLTAVGRWSARLLAYCIMPNHWHLVLWPELDGELSRFMHWLTVTHTQRWHAFHGTAGTGPLYQGRFKAVPIESDQHLLWACRYVERNPVRANLVTRAEDWRWSSMWQRRRNCTDGLLSVWPIPLPANWQEYVNHPQSEAEVAALREALQRGSPFGTEEWQQRTATELRLESTLQPRGRPRKMPPGEKDSRPLFYM